MFCDQCGAPLVAGQQRCSRCGKDIIGRIEAVYIRKNRVQEHVRLLGILWMAYAAFHILAGSVLVVLANTLFAPASRMSGPSPEVRAWLGPFLTFIGAFVLLKAFLGLLAGWGLLQHENWGRVLALVLGFVSMFMNIPLGTAIGIYTLWVLLPAQSEEEYRALSRPQAA
jgi:hypothetical protein